MLFRSGAQRDSLEGRPKVLRTLTPSSPHPRPKFSAPSPQVLRTLTPNLWKNCLTPSSPHPHPKPLKNCQAFLLTPNLWKNCQAFLVNSRRPVGTVLKQRGAGSEWRREGQGADLGGFQAPMARPPLKSTCGAHPAEVPAKQSGPSLAPKRCMASHLPWFSLFRITFRYLKIKTHGKPPSIHKSGFPRKPIVKQPKPETPSLTQSAARQAAFCSKRRLTAQPHAERN